MAFTKITAAGIGSTESVTLDGLSVINNGSFGGNLTVSGVLTYEDVTNVDSVGLITARNGIVVGSGITLSKDGDGFFTGVVTATSYYGDGSNLSNITSTTINNNANNRLITGSGTANTLEAESGLTYNGSSLLTLSGSGQQDILIGSTNAGGVAIAFDGDSNGDGSGSDYALIRHNTDGNLEITTKNPSGATSTIFTQGTAESMRIDSSGRLLLGHTSVGSKSAASPLQVQTANSGAFAVTIRNRSSNNDYSFIGFTDNDADEDLCQIGVQRTAASTADIFFYTNGGASSSSERLRINSSGHMGLGVTPNTNWPTNNDFKAFQLGTGACVFGRGSGDEDRGGIAVNYYHTGSAEKYLANGNASGILLNDGDIDFFVAGANSSGANAAMSKTTAMRIAADADIGIGTLDPEGRLHIMGGNLSGAGSMTASTSANLLVLESNTSQGMSILTASDERGTIYFGTPGTNGEIEAGIQYAHESVSTTADRRALLFRAGGGERVRIQGGMLRVGASLASASAGRFQVIEEDGTDATNDCNAYFETNAADWNIKTYYNRTGAHYHMSFVEQGSDRGNISGADGSNVAYNAGSDYRWKENVVRMTGDEGIEICKKLKPSKYNWIENREVTGKINTVDGFIAHEVEEAGVLGAVSGEKDAVHEDGSIKGQMLDYGQVTPVLSAAIKGLIDKVETLEAEVAALKSS